MPIIRAVEKAREAKETQINDRHLELINALKDIQTPIELTKRPLTPEERTEDIEREANAVFLRYLAHQAEKKKIMEGPPPSPTNSANPQMKPKSFPTLPDVTEELREEPRLVSVGALVLCRCAAQGVHEAAREVTGGSEREERVTLLALLLSGACTKTVSIRCGNQ
jgi:hypothetical protein